MAGQNTAYNQKVDEIIQDINSKNHPIAKALLLDCTDKVDVQENLLKPILEQLSSHILEADKILIDSTQKSMNECYDSFRDIANRLANAQFKACAGDFKKQFETKIKDTYDKGILGKLREYYTTELESRAGEPCEKFKSAAEQKFKNLFSFIPEQKDIESLAERGSVVPQNVYSYFAGSALAL